MPALNCSLREDALGAGSRPLGFSESVVQLDGRASWEQASDSVAPRGQNAHGSWALRVAKQLSLWCPLEEDSGETALSGLSVVPRAQATCCSPVGSLCPDLPPARPAVRAPGPWQL